MACLAALAPLTSRSLGAAPAAAAPACDAAAGPDAGPTRFIPAPDFPSSGFGRGGFFGGGITAFAVDPLAPRHLLVSNGSSLLRSEDAGCTWIPATFPRGLGALESSVVAAGLGSTKRASHGYLLVHERRDPLGLAMTPRLLHSDDGGRHWVAATSDLPPLAAPPPNDRCADVGPCTLAVAPSRPEVVYVAMSAPVARSPLLYASNDGGKSLVSRTVPGGAQTLSVLVIDPLEPETLWALAGGLHRSSDGGRTWHAVVLPSAAGVPLALDVSHASGRPARVLLISKAADGTLAHTVSNDGGRSFRAVPAKGLPEGPVSIGQRPSRGDDVVATSEGAYRSTEQGQFEPLDLSGLVPDRVRVDRTDNPAFYLVARTALIVYDAPRAVGRAAATAPNAVADVAQAAAAAAGSGAAAATRAAGGKAALTPPSTQFALAPGATKTVTYKLTIPPRPSALDVFFLVDTSGSMAPAHAGLRRGLDEIVAELQAARTDAWFGLGDFYDLSMRYRRLRDLGPPNADLVGRVASLATIRRPPPSGGGQGGLLPLVPGGGPGGGECGFGQEPNYTALHQMATGAGLENPTCGEPVPAGQGATFRPNAVHVVVHVADEVIQQDPDGPSPAEAIAALNKAGVLHVGIEFRDSGPSVLGPPGTLPLVGQSLHDQLVELSTGTHARAAGPIDCDRDGTADLAVGDPLVCTVTDNQGAELNLAPPLLQLLSAVIDRSRVELVAAEAGPVRAVVGGAPAVVDLRAGPTMEFPVTFSCRPAQTRSTSIVRLAARATGATVAQATAAVTCGSTPRIVPPVASGFTAAIGPSPVAGRAATPVPPNPPPQATQLAQAVGIVPVPEHEVQLSTQRANDDDELNFVRRSRRSGEGRDGLRLGGAAALGLVAVAVARRERLVLRPRYQRARRKVNE